MKICRSCSAENDDKATRCSDCGSSFVDDKISSAETEFLDDSHFILEEGDQIDDRFRIIRKLGEGGMGAVYLVTDDILKDKYALKLIHAKLVRSHEARERFLNEVSISRKMVHENIIRVFDFGSFDEYRYYFTMEYLQGATLAELLEQRRGQMPPFDIDAIRQIMLPLLDGLGYAHKQGSIHRDMKPGNVMVEGGFAAGKTKIKILDFGIARTMSGSRFTHISQALGTAYYMAPEQLEDAHDIDPRADLYGCGMILYELLTGKRAMGRFPLPSELYSQIYTPLDKVVVTALATDPSARYPDAAALRADLESALAETGEELDKSRKRKEQEQKEQELQARLAPLLSDLESALNSRKWERALELCEEILTLDPENSAAARARQSVEEGLRLEREKEAEEKRKAAEAARRKKEQQAEAKRRAEEAARQRELEKRIAELEERLARRVAEDHASPGPSPAAAGPVSDPGSGTPGDIFVDPFTGMEFVYVKGGCFAMGDTFGDGPDDEQPVHEVCVDDFYLGRYAVTPAEWEKVMGENPSYFDKGGKYPVESVSWEDVQEFIRRLNRKSGMNYRLPTEAEWEYAAREGGKKVRFGTGRDTIGPDEANFNACKEVKEPYSRMGWYRKETIQVNSFRPNGLGLYNMSGNVWEWCQDWYDKDYYKTSPRRNPTGPSSGASRVLRGGSWFSVPRNVRAAYRGRNSPGNRNDALGFRLAFPAQ